VHPSTVSRAVASKYVHTAQGVFELRYFFSESVQRPRRRRNISADPEKARQKLIEEEDPAHPLTDDQITRVLQSQGIQVTRRTVAKYREDMKNQAHTKGDQELKAESVPHPSQRSRADVKKPPVLCRTSEGTWQTTLSWTQLQEGFNERRIYWPPVRNHSYHRKPGRRRAEKIPEILGTFGIACDPVDGEASPYRGVTITVRNTRHRSDSLKPRR